MGQLPAPGARTSSIPARLPVHAPGLELDDGSGVDRDMSGSDGRHAGLPGAVPALMVQAVVGNAWPG